MVKEALVKERLAGLRIVAVTPELILDLLKVPTPGIRVGDKLIRVIENPIPLAAKLVRCGVDEYGVVRLTIESEEFAEIKEGDRIPDLRPIYSESIISDGPPHISDNVSEY